MRDREKGVWKEGVGRRERLGGGRREEGGWEGEGEVGRKTGRKVGRRKAGKRRRNTRKRGIGRKWKRWGGRHECVALLQVTASSVLRQSNTRVQNAWSNVKSAGFRRYLDRGEESGVSLARLEASNRDLIKKVVGLFEQFFFTPKVWHADSQ